jgi:hypothetical protein
MPMSILTSNLQRFPPSVKGLKRQVDLKSPFGKMIDLMG